MNTILMEKTSFCSTCNPQETTNFLFYLHTNNKLQNDQTPNYYLNEGSFIWIIKKLSMSENYYCSKFDQSVPKVIYGKKI